MMKGMEMNQSQRVERLRRVARAYADTVDVPRFSAAAVRARMPVAASSGFAWRWASAALAASLLVVAFAFGGRAVVAQVERMLQAFATIGGQTVPVAVSTVSLEQARRDMPFAVIAPAAIPLGFDETINELNISTSRMDSRLLFQFRNGSAPELTIIESAARGATPQASMRLWMTQSIRGEAPPPVPPPAMARSLPNAASGEHAFVQFGRNGQVQRRVRLEPLTWVVRGTRIDLISPPGLLTGEQLAAIRRAMSH
jgi:hypothetical protein